MQRTKEKSKTVGQVFTPTIKKRTKAWERGKNKAPERNRKFPTVKFLREGEELNTEYYGNETKTVLAMYRILGRANSHLSYPPSLPEKATYVDVLHDIRSKMKGVLKRGKKSYDWDGIFFDGRDVVLVEYIEQGPLFIPLDLIEGIENELSKRACMYIVGSFISKYKIPTFCDEESTINHNIEMYKEMNEDCEPEDKISKEEIALWDFPRDIKSIGKKPVGFPAYAFAQECIQVYMTGSESILDEVFSNNHSIWDNEESKTVYSIIERYKEMDEAPFQFEDLITDGIPGDGDFYPISPREYCSIIPTCKGGLYTDYEYYLNDRWNNYGSDSLTIEKRYTIEGIETNRPLLESARKYIKIVHLIHDLCKE